MPQRALSERCFWRRHNPTLAIRVSSVQLKEFWEPSAGFPDEQGFSRGECSRCPQGGLTGPVQCQPEKLVSQDPRSPAHSLTPCPACVSSTPFSPLFSAPLSPGAHCSLFLSLFQASGPQGGKQGPGNLRRLLAAQPPGETLSQSEELRPTARTRQYNALGHMVR